MATIEINLLEARITYLHTWQILLLHLQTVNLHSPTSDPPDSKYVLFSAIVEPHLKETRGKKILEQLSRTRFFTGFENPTLFFPAM